MSPIKDFLTDKGYKIESIEHSAGSAKYNPDEFAAIIVSGQNTNFLGMHDIQTKATVIDASGLTPQEVYFQLQSKLT